MALLILLCFVGTVVLVFIILVPPVLVFVLVGDLVVDVGIDL